VSSFTQLSIREILVGIISAVILALIGFLMTKFRKQISTRIQRSLQRRKAAEFSVRMLKEGVSNFYVGREDWTRYRNPPSLGNYIRQANHSVQIACYWMAQGTLEGTHRVCAELAEQKVAIEIVMIDPDSFIPEILQYDLDMTPEAIRQQVRTAIEGLQRLKSILSSAAQERFSIKVSPTLPQAAVILLDGGTATSKIQLELRPYRESRSNSFSLELTSTAQGRLYTTVERAWLSYFRDSTDIRPISSMSDTGIKTSRSAKRPSSKPNIPN
jgi:hypothetical protein